jgi:hypothetical protein
MCAQNVVTIKGKITSNGTTPIDVATVYLNNAKDSTLINYTISELNGNYKLTIQPTTSPAIFVISVEGYSDYVKKFPSISSDIDLESITLIPKPSTELDAVIVTANVAPIKIKDGTIEFNASSFVVRPDANIKSLFEQLPGFVLTDNGKVLVNGQEMKELLINGKPLFDASGQVILNNLPANIIKKIQVSDYQSREQKLANDASTSQEKTVNLTIDEDKNKGYFGNVTAGGATNSRYESSFLLNYFNNDTKISILGASNNINSLGFSNNEIFDNLVSGRNVSFVASNTGALSINNTQLGAADKGIYKNNMLGFSYRDSVVKKIDLNTSYIFNRVDFSNTNKKRIENLIPGNRFITNSISDEKSISNTQTAAIQLEIKLSTKTTLLIDPSVDFLDVKSGESGQSFTQDENNQLVSDQNYNKHNHTEQKNISTGIGLIHNFSKKDRNLVANFNVSFKNKHLDDTNTSENNFLETNATDNRNQQIKTDKNTNEVKFTLRYKEPITLKQQLTISAAYTNRFEQWNRDGLNFNNLTQSYTDLDQNLTFTNHMNVNVFTPNFTYRYNFTRGYLNIYTGSKITDFVLKNNFLTQQFHENQVQVIPEVQIAYSFYINEIRKITLRYNYNENINSLNYLSPVIDMANPLLTVIGNPYLKNNKTHFFGLGTFTFNQETKMGTYLNANFNLNTTGVITKTDYDSSFKGTLTYLSDKAGYAGYFNYGIYKSLKPNENNTLKYELYLGFGLDEFYGITNNQKYKTNWFSLYPDISLKWKYKNDFDVKLNYEFNFSNLKYHNFTIDKTQYTLQKLAIQTTMYWPKNMFFANDLNYTYNGNISPGFKKDFFLWNVSLGYKFYNETFIAKFKVYDLLDQNTNVRRTADSYQIVDQYNTILKRYFMCSLTYKFSNFVGKEKNKFKFRPDEEEDE